MLSKQSLHSACLIYIFHSELNVIACVVLGIAVSGLMLRLKAKELANDPRPPSDGIKKLEAAPFRGTKQTLAQRLPDDLENKICSFTAS